ncbi:hypothetical protein [Luteolibacter luteus]|uniref:Tetratricopeptide repeat protein n=1 Tax=Luteolibacter luteus TaxID=2728835 RepID=A0A858RNP7_9BACT|nr:hypothetical protein [Luteolibacter luteus]QJE97563.1 hypothetical protein HHL09_17840 [Luteolibacter luteus]
MKNLSSTGWSGALAFALVSFIGGSLQAQDAPKVENPKIVFSNGRGITVDALAVEGGKFVLKKDSDGVAAGQSFALNSASHVSGEKPAAINQAIALVLEEKPKEALALLEPILASQKASASVPGNYWVEAARAALYANSLYNEPAKAETLGKEISDATPQQGNDPSIRLGKAMALGKGVKSTDRIGAFGDLVSEDLPAEISAVASFCRAKLLQQYERPDEAFQAYLTVGCLYPTGGIIVTSASELRAAQILSGKNRREEAVALLTSAERGAKGTSIGDEAAKLLESMK